MAWTGVTVGSPTYDGDKLKPFTWWSSHVLPTVYDNSLSYYEVLDKLCYKISESFEDVNALGVDVKKLFDDLTKLNTNLGTKFGNIDSDIRELYKISSVPLPCYITDVYNESDVENYIDLGSENDKWTLRIVNTNDSVNTNTTFTCMNMSTGAWEQRDENAIVMSGSVEISHDASYEIIYKFKKSYGLWYTTDGEFSAMPANVNLIDYPSCGYPLLIPDETGKITSGLWYEVYLLSLIKRVNATVSNLNEYTNVIAKNVNKLQISPWLTPDVTKFTILENTIKLSGTITADTKIMCYFDTSGKVKSYTYNELGFDAADLADNTVTITLDINKVYYWDSLTSKITAINPDAYMKSTEILGPPIVVTDALGMVGGTWYNYTKFGTQISPADVASPAMVASDLADKAEMLSKATTEVKKGTK